jgi:hypothetical protein
LRTLERRDVGIVRHRDGRGRFAPARLRDQLRKRRSTNGKIREDICHARKKVCVFVENEVGLVAITARARDDGATSGGRLRPRQPGAAELVESAAVECRAVPEDRDYRAIVKVPRLHGMKFIRRNGVTVRIEVPARGAM